MAKKEVIRVAKLQFNAGQAKPGPELAGLGINMPNFTRAFNDKTKSRNGEPVPVIITVYKDKSFIFDVKTAPASFKLLQAANLESGSANSKTTIVGKINVEQLREIAQYKLVDLNTNDLEKAMNQIAGTAKNMGIVIEGRDDIAKIREEAKEAEAANQAAALRELELEKSVKEAAETAKADTPIEVESIKGSDHVDEETESEGDK